MRWVSIVRTMNYFQLNTIGNYPLVGIGAISRNKGAKPTVTSFSKLSITANSTMVAAQTAL